MKATEAKRITDQYTGANEEMKKIFSEIKESARSGEYFKIVNHLTQKQKEVMIGEGYDVFTNVLGSVTIDWRDAK